MPVWVKDIGIGSRMINARAETVAEKPAFRAAFKARRCLIVADGFYEWQKQSDRTKQPYFITVADNRPFAFAGLWERWTPDGEPPLETCTIVTTAASATLRAIHDRMPVILEPTQFDDWLDVSRSLDDAKTLLQPYDGALTAYPVSTRVNSVRNDDPECVERIAVLGWCEAIGATATQIATQRVSTKRDKLAPASTTIPLAP